MENIKSLGVLIGRMLLGQIFIVSALSKIANFRGTEKYMESHHMHAVALWLMIAILVELAGSLSVLTGFRTRMGASVLIIFLFPVTFIFHRDLGDRLQLIMFMKNMAILGGLFMLLSFGPGKFSVDRWMKGKREGALQSSGGSND